MKFDRKILASAIKVGFVIWALAFFFSSLAFFFTGKSLILPDANGIRGALNIAAHMLCSIFFVRFVHQELYHD